MRDVLSRINTLVVVLVLGHATVVAVPSAAAYSSDQPGSTASTAGLMSGARGQNATRGFGRDRDAKTGSPRANAVGPRADDLIWYVWRSYRKG
jgi:hypothetical protein